MKQYNKIITTILGLSALVAGCSSGSSGSSNNNAPTAYSSTVLLSGYESNTFSGGIIPTSKAQLAMNFGSNGNPIFVIQLPSTYVQGENEGEFQGSDFQWNSNAFGSSGVCLKANYSGNRRDESSIIAPFSYHEEQGYLTLSNCTLNQVESISVLSAVMTMTITSSSQSTDIGTSYPYVLAGQKVSIPTAYSYNLNDPLYTQTIPNPLVKMLLTINGSTIPLKSYSTPSANNYNLASIISEMLSGESSGNEIFSYTQPASDIGEIAYQNGFNLIDNWFQQSMLIPNITGYFKIPLLSNNSFAASANCIRTNLINPKGQLNSNFEVQCAASGTFDVTTNQEHLTTNASKLSAVTSAPNMSAIISSGSSFGESFTISYNNVTDSPTYFVGLGDKLEVVITLNTDNPANNSFYTVVTQVPSNLNIDSITSDIGIPYTTSNNLFNNIASFLFYQSGTNSRGRVVSMILSEKTHQNTPYQIVNTLIGGGAVIKSGAVANIQWESQL